MKGALVRERKEHGHPNRNFSHIIKNASLLPLRRETEQWNEQRQLERERQNENSIYKIKDEAKK